MPNYTIIAQQNPYPSMTSLTIEKLTSSATDHSRCEDSKILPNLTHAHYQVGTLVSCEHLQSRLFLIFIILIDNDYHNFPVAR